MIGTAEIMQTSAQQTENIGFLANEAVMRGDFEELKRLLGIIAVIGDRVDRDVEIDGQEEETKNNS